MNIKELNQVKEAALILRTNPAQSIAHLNLNKKQLKLLAWSII